MAAITEKQRVSLPIPLWLSLIGIIITGAGAWFATQARAEATAQRAAANTEDLKAQGTELRAQDKRLQRVEDVQAWDREWKERLEAKVDALLSARRRKDER